MNRILHISDLHFWHLPRHPMMWLSKRACTYLGVLLNPNRRFKDVRMQQLLKTAESLNLSHVVISGDLTLSGSDHEFEMFDEFYQQLKKIVPHICLVPGNHDLYIEREWGKGFYKHALKWMDEETLHSLFEKRQASIILSEIEFILLDQARPRPIAHAEGLFEKDQATLLKQTLSQKTSAQARLVVGHYPMHPTKKATNNLEKFELLEDTLRDELSVSAYLHGHTHQQYIIDERYFGLPVSIDSGCLSTPLQAGFCTLEIQESTQRAALYRFDSLHGWQMHQELLWKSGPREIATETLML